VVIAAALKADVCEIYTDVDGVYTTDPNMCSSARKIDRVSYEEMLELASLGAKVLQIRSVELGMNHGVKIHVRSSFNHKPGTWVVPEEASMEAVVVSGVSANRDEAKITLFGVPDEPGVAARIFKPLTAANIIVDMIIQNVSAEGRTDLTFTVPRGDCKRAVEMLKTECADLTDVGRGRISFDEGLAKVSIVGVGMRSHAGVAQKMFELLANHGINIVMISTSEIRISVVIDAKYTELAVRVLHDGFGLDKPPAQRATVA
jgi:aspartate kinase